MTVKSLSELIGRRVSVAFESIRVTCEITDVKVSYGKTRLQVKPISGSRDQWIEPARVTAFVTGDIEQWTIPCDLTMTTLQGVK